MSMTTGSSVSKSEFSDPNAGFVSITDIRNIFIEFMRDLDKKVMPVGQHVNRMEVLKHVESIQYRLFQRAHANIEKFFPGYKAPLRKEAEIDPKVLKDSADARKERVAAIRGRS